jgi:hypothetical protein
VFSERQLQRNLHLFSCKLVRSYIFMNRLLRTLSDDLSAKACVSKTLLVPFSRRSIKAKIEFGCQPERLISRISEGVS